MKVAATDPNTLPVGPGLQGDTVKPLIPFFEIPVFEIPLPGGLSLFGKEYLEVHGFGLLVMVGFLLGGWLAMRRAERVGLDKERINQLVGWLVVGTFIGGHVGYGLMYKPAEYLADPRKFLYIWEGLSSFGGFFVCVPLCIYFFRKYKMPVWANLDCVAHGFALGWFFGRLGCTVAHDHPGTATNFVLGVHCRPVEGHTLELPGWMIADMWKVTDLGPPRLDWGPCAESGLSAATSIHDTVPALYENMTLACHDMGFYEALLSGGTFLLFLLLDRRPMVPGVYPLLIGVTYGPARFLMDFLRPESTDGRYLSLTPGQWGSILVFAVSAYFLWKRFKSGDAPVWAPAGSKKAADDVSDEPGDAPPPEDKEDVA